MATCDICGKELGDRPDMIRLYSAHLLNREVQAKGIEAYTAPKIATSYSAKPKPVTLQVCRRHQWDLVKQRVITGFFVFLLIFLPMLYIFGKLSGLFGLVIYYQVAIAFAISLILAGLIVRIVHYDSLIAVRMTTRSKMEKSDLEYMTEGKYRKLVGKKRK
jgi:hypothetical protein